MAMLICPVDEYLGFVNFVGYEARKRVELPQPTGRENRKQTACRQLIRRWLRRQKLSPRATEVLAKHGCITRAMAKNNRAVIAKDPRCGAETLAEIDDWLTGGPPGYWNV